MHEIDLGTPVDKSASGAEGSQEVAGQGSGSADPPLSGSARQRIISEADNVARLYLEGKRLGQPVTREQKEVIEGILAADYEGRTLVELLQNGHDAHDVDDADGRLEFWLRGEEGEHGVLYVANGGEPLKDENFTSLCRIGMSPKRPDQGIGNKGVGFKSVLQLSRSPEVYSMASAKSGRFDGYCFRFARPETMTPWLSGSVPVSQGSATNYGRTWLASRSRSPWILSQTRSLPWRAAVS